MHAKVDITDVSEWHELLHLSGIRQETGLNKSTKAAFIVGYANLQTRLAILESFYNMLRHHHLPAIPLIQEIKADLEHHQSLMYKTALRHGSVPQQFQDLVYITQQNTRLYVPTLYVASTTRNDVMNGAPALINAIDPKKWLIFLHLTDTTLPTSLSAHIGKFDQLPRYQQEAIIHHEFAHGPTASVDTIIQTLSRKFCQQQPGDMNWIHHTLESCVDASAVVLARDPAKIATGLKDLLVACKAQSDHLSNVHAECDYRINKIDEVMDIIKRSPQFKIQNLINTGLRAGTDILKRLPK